ncbi:MAG TPA: hypothetical protein VFK05_11065 [Polyangiaceae bacterium]|nr:hypothetical protein [Polyangiaceae bacterium]
MSIRQSLFGCVLVAVAAIAQDGVAAPPPVQIKYGQVVNFYQMDNHNPSQPGPVSSFTAGGGMFIMYRIKHIENNGSTPFTFKSDNVISLGPGGNSNDEMPNQYPFVGHLGSVTVAAGTGKDFPGCIVKWVKANNPSELANTNALVDLKYPDAKMTRAQIDTATIVLQGAAWPERLANLCTL